MRTSIVIAAVVLAICASTVLVEAKDKKKAEVTHKVRTDQQACAIALQLEGAVGTAQRSTEC
jgi:hypothetical protein